MPDLYVFIIVLLFGLAIADLVVGVSNDAVNFLNSAVGSKVASRHVIMIVASLGILLGATFSGGMMEVARKGMFNPEYYYFYDIMALFLAVMLTDIILLDLFNTFGLPTSTTVSIVFELLGAAVVIAAIKSFRAGEGMDSIGQYINGDNAVTIISGIFLSIAIAFTIGALIMYLSRLLFTFQYHRRLNWVGALWSGLALAAMTYFLLIKGLKGAAFVPAALTAWVEAHTGGLLLLSFAGWSMIMLVLIQVFRVNILRLIVLFGTFSLAMAFAGNDLVNFIGVPIAGFESFLAWRGSGQAAGSFPMAALGGAYSTNTWLLLGAGIIMTLTLWFSRKARSVTDTEVNLSRQHEGLERFSPNWLSQIIVRGVLGLSQLVRKLIPDRWLSQAEASFLSPAADPAGDNRPRDLPAFDLVRAAVNLTVASALIAMATSYKLPLSTTYVSFMVAMGSSLADRAWGRDSAVYRVAGVLNVIGGWFATALIAFSVSGAFAFLIHTFGLAAILGLLTLAVVFIVRTFVIHQRRERVKAKREAAQAEINRLTTEQITADTAHRVADSLKVIGGAFRDALEGLRREDLPLLKRAKEAIKTLREQNEEFRYTFYNDIQRTEEIYGRGSRGYLLVYDLRQDILQSADFVVKACRDHVKNSHRPLEPSQDKELKAVASHLTSYLDRTSTMLDSQDFTLYREIKKLKKDILIELERLMVRQVDGIKQNAYNARNSLLYFSLLLEAKDIVAVAARFAKLYYRLRNAAIPADLTLVTETEEQEEVPEAKLDGGQ